MANKKPAIFKILSNNIKSNKKTPAVYKTQTTKKIIDNSEKKDIYAYKASELELPYPVLPNIFDDSDEHIKCPNKHLVGIATLISIFWFYSWLYTTFL